MNVVIQVQGREAILVRAMPFLTYWNVMSPDELAKILAYRDLLAYKIDEGAVRAISSDWWKNFSLKQLTALEDTIRHSAISEDVGYAEWRIKSLAVLPSSAFVWKDEFEAAHQRIFGSESVTFSSLSKFDNSRWTDEANYEVEHNKHIALDFSPLIEGPEIKRLVMEGFDQPEFNKSAPINDALPVRAVSDDDTSQKPLQRSAAQDAAILDEIKKQGYNPTALPKNDPGKSGIKAAVRQALSKKKLFSGTTVFDKAWERLTKCMDIVIQG